MSHKPTDGMHERFAEWLAQGAHGDPPRDAAVHAFVCPACQRQMAAIDALAEIDPGRATLPPSRPLATSRSRSSLPGLRLAAAASGMLVLTLVVSFGASRLLAAPDVATSSETPMQAVLGGEGSPGPHVGTIGGEVQPILPSPTPIPAGESPTAVPTGKPNSPAATRRPVATQRPGATEASTRTSTATPTREPTSSPSASASASIEATPSPTAIPTATPTPVPTSTATPTPPPTTPEPTPSAPQPPSAS